MREAIPNEGEGKGEKKSPGNYVTGLRVENSGSGVESSPAGSRAHQLTKPPVAGREEVHEHCTDANMQSEGSAVVLWVWCLGCTL